MVILQNQSVLMEFWKIWNGSLGDKNEEENTCEKHIKYSSVLLAFYDSSMVKHRKISPVSFLKMKMNIVIFITTVNLFPDT